VRISEDEFEKLYKPITNHFEEASFCGWLFETYGEQLEYVRKQDSNYIWTIIEADTPDADLVIISGYHLVNRFGYILTHKPHNGEQITVFDEDF